MARRPTPRNPLPLPIEQDEFDTLLTAEDGGAYAEPDLTDVIASNSVPHAHSMALINEKHFYFQDIVGIGYGELVRIRLRLFQIRDLDGYVELQFTQQMRCRRSNVVKGADVSFRCKLIDAFGSDIRWLNIGSFDRRCGNHFIELRSPFSWTNYSINPVEATSAVQLEVTWKQRVHGC